MKLNSREDLISARAGLKKLLDAQSRKILVCGGSGCIAGGSAEIFEELKHQLQKRGLDVQLSLEAHVDHSEIVGLKTCGCHGICEMAPLIRIEPEGYLYMRVRPEDCEDIITETVLGGRVIDRLVYKSGNASYPQQDDIPFYKNQTRVVLDNCGRIDANSIEEYLAVGGYSALEKALFEMTPEQIVTEVSDSGLRGRGGAGFPVGKKWSQVASHKDAAVKYIICNGDEGDPGSFMDCSIMEGDPHKVLEGMILAGIACDAKEGVIYVRAEYPLAVKRLTSAVKQAEEYGLLGDDILGTGKAFRVEIVKGAGAFVCGESTAMQEAIEGHRAMPRTKQIHSADVGLFGAPTALNNVETFANVPAIISKGAKWFSSIGAPNNSGTKVFSLAGSIAHTGLVEVPMGSTLRHIVFDVGGGVKTGSLKAIQLGGPAGCCLPPDQLDIPVDFDSLKKIGAIMGSAGVVVMGDDTCMVEIARFFMNFSRKESCGKCSVCREGIPQIQEILDRMTHGTGELEDIDTLQELANALKSCSLCGLGKNAANPLLSTLKYFKSEYVAHVKDKKCPAGVCRSLCVMTIDPKKCIGCTKCARNCPVGAIIGELRKPHYIDVNKCIKCRVCKTGCPKNAIKEA